MSVQCIAYTLGNLYMSRMTDLIRQLDISVTRQNARATLILVKYINYCRVTIVRVRVLVINKINQSIIHYHIIDMNLLEKLNEYNTEKQNGSPLSSRSAC